MNPLTRFLKLYRPYRLWVALSLLLGCSTLLAQIGLLALSGWFIASMGIAGLAGLTINYFTPAAIIRALAIIRTGGRYGERLISHEATFRITTHFRTQLYHELNQRSGITETLHSTDLFGRLRADMDRLERFFLLGFLPVCISAVGVLAVTLTLFYFLPLLALVEMLLLALIGVAAPFLLQRHARTSHAAIALQQTQLRQALAETASGMAEMAVYGQLPVQQQTLAAHSSTLIAQETRLGLGDALMQALVLPAIGLAVTAALVLTAQAVATGQLPASFLAMLPLLSLAAFDTVATLPTAWQQFPAARAAATRLFALLDAPTVTEGSATLAQANAFHLRCALPALPPRLSQPVSFTLHAGEQVALVGPSGTGKTTLLQYVTGLLTPPLGTLFLNDQDTATLKLGNWRRQFSVAEQQAPIFAGTVRDNLLLASPTATDLQLQHACQQMQLPLEHWREGLDTRLGSHGATLSGGERRRLSLARAWLRPAPCLILDEPTEGLDKPMAEPLIRTLLAEARTRNQAVLIITHDNALAAMLDRTLTLTA